MEKRAEKSAARLLEKLNGSAFLSSKGDRERVLFFWQVIASASTSAILKSALMLWKNLRLSFFSENLLQDGVVKTGCFAEQLIVPPHRSSQIMVF